MGAELADVELCVALDQHCLGRALARLYRGFTDRYDEVPLLNDGFPSYRPRLSHAWSCAGVVRVRLEA